MHRHSTRIFVITAINADSKKEKKITAAQSTLRLSALDQLQFITQHPGIPSSFIRECTPESV
jgi:hypothetical protein